MSRIAVTAAVAAVCIATIATGVPALARKGGQGGQARHDYLGTLQSMNGSGLTGMVAFKTTEDGRLIVSLGAADVSPGAHMAHIHGFTGENPEAAACPGGDADANEDGVIDLIETESVAGKTLVPLSADPASLSVKDAEGYPTADKDGSVLYLETAALKPLERALKETHGTPLALDKRVVFVHGLPEGVAVPDSVRSLPGVPAQATLPIACAEISVKPIAP